MASKCRCLYTCPNNVLNGTCHLLPGGSCFTSVEKILDQDRGIFQMETRYGCFPPGEGTLLQCKGHLVPHHIPTSIICCNDKDFCNVDLIPTDFNLKSFQDDDNYNDLLTFDQKVYIVLFLSGILFFTLVGILLKLFCSYLNNRKCQELENKSVENDYSEKMGFISDGSNSMNLLLPNVNYIQKTLEYPSVISPRTFNMTNNSSTSESSGSAGSIKYYYLNNSNSNNSQNGSNFTINSYRNMSSATSNTMSSIASENTQQTTLSTQKPMSINSLPPLSENSVTSGSGSGVPHLVQQTLAREIHLVECIGKGRFGNVWLGIRQCEKVAVKIFFSRDEASWKRETEIYTTAIIRHENILGFFGADVTSLNGCTQLWLVTDYHNLGSLYDFLNRNSINSVHQLLSLMKSIIFGVSHLHIEVIGTLGKPAIAHRDIKSKNILMKSNMSCCIADFGLAVIKTESCKNINIAKNHRAGTKRYMAPEVLDETMKTDRFQSYCEADIYSLALVFWEMVNSLTFNGEANIYNAPYEGLVPNDPSFEDMRQVVCVEKMRPQFYNMDIKNNQILPYIFKLISECWSSNPSARLTSLRIKKSIMAMLQSISN